MKINPSLKVPERLPADQVPYFQSNRPWLCNDLVAYSDLQKGRSILLVDRKEPPVRGVLWFPGGAKVKNVGLEDSVDQKLKAECGIGIGKDAEIIRSLGAFDFSTAEDLPWTPGKRVAEVKDGFHAVSVNYAVRINPEAASRIIVDNTSKGHQWFTMDELRDYGAMIEGFHPYFAETANAAAPELGLNPRISLAEVNVAKYGMPVNGFDR